MEKSGPSPGSPLECGGFWWTTLDWTCQFGPCDTEKVWVTSLVDSSRLRWNPTESGRSCGAVYSPRRTDGGEGRGGAGGMAMSDVRCITVTVALNFFKKKKKGERAKRT